MRNDETTNAFVSKNNHFGAQDGLVATLDLYNKHDKDDYLLQRSRKTLVGTPNQDSNFENGNGNSIFIYDM